MVNPESLRRGFKSQGLNPEERNLLSELFKRVDKRREGKKGPEFSMLSKPGKKEELVQKILTEYEEIFKTKGLALPIEKTDLEAMIREHLDEIS